MMSLVITQDEPALAAWPTAGLPVCISYDSKVAGIAVAIAAGHFNKAATRQLLCF
jgi:hypothetical protein